MALSQSGDAASWTAFLANAIGGLRLAAVELRIRRREFEAKDGWFRSGHGDIPHEESVSSALAELFNVIRAEQTISGSGVQPVDLRHISVMTERPRKLDRGIGRKSNPTDYSFVFLKDSELDFRIEAKTILNNSDVDKEYLGKRGLLRFEDSTNPYTIERFGGMVAYVVDLDSREWGARISKSLLSLLGSRRSSLLSIGGEEFQISHHSISFNLDGSNQNCQIDVVHFVIEIDASPTRRPCVT